MSHNKLYRNFIILQEDERGHSSESEKALSGYAKVEAKGDKCKISFYAQNLRKEDNYSMVLICCKRDFKELIDLGPLVINEVGKGDTSKEYYINNIAGLGISYEKVSGAAICKTAGNDMNFIMHGFMNGEEPTENWRKFKLVKVELKKEDSALEAKKSNDKVISSEVKKSNDKVISSKVEDINLSERNENIKVGSVEKNDSNTESIEEKISEEILSEEERNKCKKDKKCEKEECKDKKCEKEECKKEEYKKTDKDECKKYDKDEVKKEECKKDSFEEMIDKLCDKIDDCNHYIDLNIHDIDCEYVVYGFIKKKDDKKCEWKKFKVKKGKEDFSYKGHINRRIEENTKLDLDLESTDFDKYEKDIKGLNDSNNSNMNGSVSQYFEKIVRGFDVYDDKLNDIDNCKWYRVNVNSIEDLCNESNYNKYTLAYYPMINYYPYISKNNHFLLGYKCDTGGELQYIVYGIPGSKDKEEQPYGGKTGFVTWTSNNKRSQGYWLMFYDFKKSSIVVPMKK